MAEGRFLSKSIAHSEQLAAVSIEADYLFTRCIPHLDVEGRMIGNPQLVKAVAVPLRPEITVDSIPALLHELVDAALVNWYTADGRQVIAFPGFARHQRGLRKNREAASRLPPPPASQPEQPADTGGDTPEPLRSDSGASPANIGVSKVEVEGKLKGRTTNLPVEPGGSTAVAAVVGGSMGSTALARRSRRAQSVAQITTRLGSLLEEVGAWSVRERTADEFRKLQGEFVFAYWAQRTGHPKALYDAKREARLLARLRENAGDVNELLYVVDGALRSPYHAGQNEQGTRYFGIETIYRDRAQVEKLAALCPKYTTGEPHPMVLKYSGVGAAAEDRSVSAAPALDS